LEGGQGRPPLAPHAVVVGSAGWHPLAEVSAQVVEDHHRITIGKVMG
jgi:hypothetical protein